MIAVVENMDIFVTGIASVRHIWSTLAALSTDMTYVAERQLSSCDRPVTDLGSLPSVRLQLVQRRQMPSIDGSWPVDNRY